jgi:hypothetical protein
MDDGDGDGKGPLSSADEQRSDRDSKGRFVEGNPFRWTKGSSGNRDGRPRGMKAIFAQAFRELAEEQSDDEKARQLEAGPVVLAKALIMEALGPQPFRVALPDEDDDRASFTDLRIRVMTREDVERERERLISGNGDDPSEDDVPE